MAVFRGKITCFRCGKPISGARTVIEEHWYCSDCTYLHDHPDAVVSPRKASRSRRDPQDERLFDPPPKEIRIRKEMP